MWSKKITSITFGLKITTRRSNIGVRSTQDQVEVLHSQMKKGLKLF
jgi:hypothetical protein